MSDAGSVRVCSKILQDTLRIVGVLELPNNHPFHDAARCVWTRARCALTSTSQSACEGRVEAKLASLRLHRNESAYCEGLTDVQCITEVACCGIRGACVLQEEVRLLKDFECEYVRRGEFELLFPADDAQVAPCRSRFFTTVQRFLPYFPVPRRENHLMAWWHSVRYAQRVYHNSNACAVATHSLLVGRCRGRVM